MNTLCWKFWIGRKKGEFHTIKTNRQGHESMGDWEQISMSFCSSIILNIFVLNLFKKKKKGLASYVENLSQKAWYSRNTGAPQQLALGLHQFCVWVCMKTPGDSLSHFLTTSLHSQQTALPQSQSLWAFKCQGSKGNYHEIPVQGHLGDRGGEWVPAE